MKRRRRRRRRRCLLSHNSLAQLISVVNVQHFQGYPRACCRKFWTIMVKRLNQEQCLMWSEFPHFDLMVFMALEIHGCLLKHYSLIIFSKFKERGNILHFLILNSMPKSRTPITSTSLFQIHIWEVSKNIFFNWIWIWKAKLWWSWISPYCLAI